MEGVDAAARAESRRRPARWAGFKPPILRSTSTIVVKLCWYLYVYRDRWRREERGQSGEEWSEERESVV